MTAAAAPPSPRADSARAVAIVAVVALTLAATALTVAASASAIDAAPERNWSLGWLTWHVAVLAVVLIASWTALRDMPVAASGMAILGLGLVLPVLSGAPSLPPQWRAVLVALGVLTLAGASLLAPGLSRAHLGLLSNVGIGLALAAGAVQVLAVDPGEEPGCQRLCRSVEPVLAWPGSRAALGVTAALILASATVSAFHALSTRITLTSAERLWLVAAFVLLAVPWVVRWVSWADGSGRQVLLHAGAFGAGTAGLIVLTHGIRQRRRAAALAADIARLQSLGGALQLARPGTSDWLTPEGRPALENPTTTYRVVQEAGAPVARWPEQDSRSSISPALRLGLVNAQLTAAASAELRDVRESQRRVVAASDAERTRIERDLHDGVQQRIVGALLALGAGRPEQDTPQAHAAQHLKEALSRLRSLTSGLVNPVLASEGLWAALEDLADNDRTVRLDLAGEEPTDPEICRTAYIVVETTLQHTSTTAVATRVAITGDSKTVRLTIQYETLLENSTDELTDIADRVGATGGSLTLDTERARLEVTLPCAS